MHNPGKSFRDLLRTEPYLFTGGVYSPLDAQIAERVGHEVHLPQRLLDGHGQRLARHGLPDPDRGDPHRVHGGQRRRDPGHRRRRRRLRQRALHHPHGAGVRASGRGRHPHRGPASSPSAAATSRARRSSARGGRREVPRGRRHARPARSRTSSSSPAPTPSAPWAAAWRRRSGAAAPTPTPAWISSGRSCRAPTASPPSPSPGPCASRTRTCRWPSTTRRRSSGTRTPTRSRSAELGELGYKFIFITLFAAHAGMYAVWNAMEELVKDQEQAQWRLEKTKAGHPTESHHVMARVSALPGAGEAVHPGQRRAHQGLGRLRRQAHALRPRRGAPPPSDGRRAPSGALLPASPQNEDCAGEARARTRWIGRVVSRRSTARPTDQ